MEFRFYSDAFKGICEQKDDENEEEEEDVDEDEEEEYDADEDEERIPSFSNSLFQQPFVNDPVQVTLLSFT